MPNTEIANLTAGTAPTGAELAHVVQGGNSRKLTTFQLAMASQAVLASQTTPPGVPTLGDKYIVTATATGAWAGQEDDIAIYNGSTWDFYTPAEGWIIYDQGANMRMQFDGASWAEFTSGGGGSSAYDLRFGFTSTPTSSQVIDTVPIVRELTFSANLANSVGNCDTNPTSSFVLSLKDDGTEIGTITISTGGTFTFATDGGTSKVVAAGSILTLVAPASADATVADVSISLYGTG